jgi:hypothetical protein
LQSARRCISFPVIRDQVPVVLDVRAQCCQRLHQASIPGIGLAERLNRALQIANLAQRFVYLTALITAPATWPLSGLSCGSPWWTQRRWR